MKHLKQLAALALVLLLGIGPVYAAELYTDGFINYTVEDGGVVIKSYVGKEEEVTLPSAIAGQPVSVIDSGAFANNTAVKIINLPDTVMEVREGAFAISQAVIFNSNTDNPHVSESVSVPPAEGQTGAESTMAAGQTTAEQAEGTPSQGTEAGAALASSSVEDNTENPFGVEEVEADLSGLPEISSSTGESAATESESGTGSADAQETSPAESAEPVSESTAAESNTSERSGNLFIITAFAVMIVVTAGVVLIRKKKDK